MNMNDFIKKLSGNKKFSMLIFGLGIVGMLLILISSLIPESDEISEQIDNTGNYNYLVETENRLTDFLESMEGVGNVKVMIELEGDELYIYAKEDKKTVSENKTEQEESYVMSGREQTPVLETVNNPQIKGVVIACDGANNSVVKESVYYTVSKLFGISSSNIYVTKLN